jgi:hypothetical protein
MICSQATILLFFGFQTMAACARQQKKIIKAEISAVIAVLESFRIARFGY